MTQAETIEAPAAAERMSYDEFLRRTDGIAAEWVDGKVIIMAAVSNDHALISGFLYHLIEHFVQSQKAGLVFTEPFVMKPGQDLPGRSPDVCFLSTENIGRLRENDLHGPADLAVEVVSPESQTRDRGEKYYEYEQGGVREYWLIDPLRRQAEFYVRGEDGLYRPSLPDTAGIFHSTVLPGLWLKVAWLWQKPLPPLLAVLKEWRLI